MASKTMEEMTGISADEFHALEEKVYKTIELLKAAREGRAIAERDLKHVREQLEEREEEVESMRAEMIRLRRDREEVKGRVERMLKQIDNLTAEAEG